MASSSLFTANDADDPLSKALQPPPDESPDDRARRIQQQKEAQAISHRIDEDIQESRKAFERRKKAIKILLLGAHTRSPLVARAADPACRTGGIREEHNAQECVSFRRLCAHILIAVLQTSNSRSLHNTFAANALPGVPSSSSTSFGASPRHTQPSVLTGRSSIKRLLEVLQEEWDESAQPLRSGTVDKGKGKAVATASAPRSPPKATVRFSTSPLTDQHRRMRMRLSPLLPIEEQLTRKLLPEANDRLQDVCVRAGSGWKGLLASLQDVGGSGDGKGREPRRPSTAEGKKDDPTAVLAACRDDIIALWEDPVVKSVLKRRGIRLQDMPGLCVFCRCPHSPCLRPQLPQ